MRPRVVFRKGSLLTLKIPTSPECDIAVGILDDADFTVCDDRDALDTDWLKRCQDTGTHIIVPNQAQVPEGITVIRVPINISDAYSFEKVIRRIQKQLPNTRGKIVDWPRVPKSAKTIGIGIDLFGGIGDMVGSFSVLEELTNQGCRIYVSDRQRSPEKEILLESAAILGIAPPACTVISVSWDNINDLHTPRQKQYAKGLGVVLKTTLVNFRSDEPLRAKYREWKAGFGRPMVVLGCTTREKMKSLPVEKVKQLAEALSANYEVSIIHKTQTAGDLEHVHDWGGKLSIHEMVNLIAVADGAICIDGGVAHICCGLRIPTVVMQGVCGIGNHIQYPLYFTKGEQKAGKIKELSKNLRCQPCWPSFSCGTNRYTDCMNFSIEEIVTEFEKVVKVKNVTETGTLTVHAGGGIGDVLAMLPALQAKREEGYTLKMGGETKGHGKELFAMSPIFGNAVDDVVGDIKMRPCDPTTDTQEDRDLPIQDWHAKCAAAKVKDYRVQLRLDEQLLRQYQSWVYSQKRPVIGVSFNSANTKVSSRTMPEAPQRRLIEALGERYHVAVIHSGRTCGDATNVTDWGGKVNTKEMIHLIAALDGIVAVDSGPAHVACVTGTPLVVLMGIVRGEKRYAKYGGNAVRWLDLDLECSPCWEKGSYGCEKPPKCLEFTPDDVLPALRDVCGFLDAPKDPYWDWTIFCRGDRPFTEVGAKAYIAEFSEIHRMKYELVKSLPKISPKRIAEIGVREGNGARDMKMAWPEAYYHGFDAENGKYGGGPQVLTAYARTLLERFWPGTSEITAPFDSQQAQELPGGPYDFLHIDGDHSVKGCQHDLDLALKALAKGGMILVDDITHLADVKAGCSSWLFDHAGEVDYSFHQTKRGDIAIWRKE